MTNMELGIYGAKRQTWRGNGARAILYRLRKQNPDAPVERLIELMIPLVRNNDEALEQIIEYWLPRNLHSLEPQPEVTPQQRATQRERGKREAERVVTQMKERIRRVSLLEMQMPNGKLYRDCTGPEVAKFGGFHSRVAKVIGNKKVGDVLSEKQLWGMMK